jgi:polyferredoxin
VDQRVLHHLSYDDVFDVLHCRSGHALRAHLLRLPVPTDDFPEAANSLEARIRRMVNRRFSGLGAIARRALAVALFSAVLLPAAVFVSFVFISFFVQPADLFHRLLSLDIRPSGGILGASVTLFTLLDFVFLRQRFCTAICPYGYLQNMLADSNTPLVHFHDAKGICIHCDKCVRACLSHGYRHSPVFSPA